MENLAGAKCTSIYADAWNPKWGNFTGSSQALITLKFDNGFRAAYETAWSNASAQNSWENEYSRAEFDQATIVLNGRKIDCFPAELNQKGPLTGIPIELKQNPKWANDYLLQEFVNWVSGGREMETNIESNFRSILLVFAAIESSNAGLPIDIHTFSRSFGL